MFEACPPIKESGNVGLIGLSLEGGLAERITAESSEEPALWQEWLTQTLEGESVKYANRIGRHLWLYAEVPGSPGANPDAYIDGLARRLKDKLTLETSLSAPEGSGFARDDGTGFGTAVIRVADRRRLDEKLYEAFLAAAARLQSDEGRSDPFSVQRAEMERLLKDHGIRSVYQPIFRLKDGQVFGYEALTRCPPGSPFAGPLEMFRFADREGYAFALDRKARETAIRSCPLLGARQKIFLNVNAGIMKDPGFVSGQTVQWLAERGFKPGQVVFELTERDSIDDFEEAKKTLDHYRSQGYEIAIDDAGAGYSSLQSIVELRPDYIKLDKSLVQRADEDDMKKYMLGTFVRFAKRMNIRTVAEGIERAEELRLVRTMGIDFAQGYLIGRPSEQPALAFAAGLPRNG